MSRPSEPLEMVSISTGLPPLPSRMIEPLPKARSICDSAASSAFVLSIAPPSTTRNVFWAMYPPYDRDSPDRQTHPARLCRDQVKTVYMLCSEFAICSFLASFHSCQMLPDQVERRDFQIK